MLLRRHSLCASIFVRVSGRPGEAALLFLCLVCASWEGRLEEIHPAAGGMNLQNPSKAGPVRRWPDWAGLFLIDL